MKRCILEGMETAVVNHPLVQPRLTILRDVRTDNTGFRVALVGLDVMLTYGASRELPVDSFNVQTPITTVSGYRLQDLPIIAPVICVGLSMIDPSLSTIPDVQANFIGPARDEETHEPVPYLETLLKDLSGRTVFPVDLMLATGGPLLHALKSLVDRDADNITAVRIISVQQGVDALEEPDLLVRFATTAVDPDLNEDVYIVPGLGDTNDHLYGPRNIDL